MVAICGYYIQFGKVCQMMLCFQFFLVINTEFCYGRINQSRLCFLGNAKAMKTDRRCVNMANDRWDNMEFSSHLLPQVAAQVRTAMANIHMALNLLRPADLDGASDKVIQNISILNQSYYRLLRLAKNLSSAAVLSDNTLFKTEAVELVALLGALVDPVEAFAQEKDITFTFTCDQAYILTAVHVEYFQTMLYHLLSNAFKFTPAGGEVRLEAHSGQTGHITITVTDTGCGIPPEEIDTVFDRYLSTEHAAPPPHGLGLGLAISRRIAQRHGGTLLLNSQEGKGTCITVLLPRIKPQHATFSDIQKNYEGDRSLFFTADGYSTALTHMADALPYRLYSPRHLE